MAIADQYLKGRGRSLIAVSARRAIRRANETAGLVLLKPFVVMAARVLGPGPMRLRLVKLAHNLDARGIRIVEPPAPSVLSVDAYGEASPVQPARRAA